MKETEAIVQGQDTTILKRAVIDTATSGDTTIVAAVTGKRIRVHSVVLVGGGSVTARFESGAGGTALTGQMTLATGSVVEMGWNPAGWFETADGALLNLELSGATTVDGCIVYSEV